MNDMLMHKLYIYNNIEAKKGNENVFGIAVEC